MPSAREKYNKLSNEDKKVVDDLVKILKKHKKLGPIRLAELMSEFFPLS